MDMKLEIIVQDLLMQLLVMAIETVFSYIVSFLMIYSLFILVPIVTIVVEGGPDTLLTIYNDLCSEIPVVLVDVSVFISMM